MSVAAASMTGSGGNDGLLALVLTAGKDDTFQARLAALQQSEADAKAAFEALRIGNDAKAAFEQAEAARLKYEHLLSQANSDAEVVRAKASEEATATRKAADDVLAQARADAEQIRADAVAIKAKAEQLQVEAVEARKSAQAAQDAAQAASAAVAQREQALADARAEVTAEIGRVKDVLAQMRALAQEL